jgi:putative spermidine/putrescine transport system substrate-binding protein
MLRDGGRMLAGGLAAGSFLAGCVRSEPAASAPADPEPRVSARPPRFSGTLRVLGLPVDLLEPVRAAARRELDFRIAFEVTDSVSMVQRALTEPSSFHLLSGYAHQIDQIWPSGNLVGIDRSRLVQWENVNPLLKVGAPSTGGAYCSVGDGDAPFRKLYTSTIHASDKLVEWGADDGSGAPAGMLEPPAVTAVPTSFGFDSLAYSETLVELRPAQVSWAELFNQRWSGRVGLLNDPSSYQDAAIAADAAGLLTVRDKGNLSREEIDALTKLLVKLRRSGQIAHLWTTFDEAVELFSSGDVVIGPTWSSAASYLKAIGSPVRYADPPEGYRAWCGGLSLSRHALGDEAVLAACYEYMNWWHSGLPGAMMARYGFYNAVQETSRLYLDSGEWDYWIEGRPAPTELDSAYGEGSIAAGEVRDGGSLERRACRVAAWLSHFDETHEYEIGRWNELLEA